MIGQSLQQIYFILRVLPTYLLWTLLTGFQLCTSATHWEQIFSEYGWPETFLTIDHAIQWSLLLV